MELRDPSLYAPALPGHAGPGDAATLLALRDPATGALAFPRTPYGIGASGLPAEAAEPVALSGRGEVLICITIHQPLSPGMITPMLIARLRLEEGLVLDGVLEGTEEPAPGTRVQAMLVPQEKDGATVMACRFRVLA